MPETLWYENSETKVQWHVEIGSEAQLRLAEDPSYRPLESEPEAAVAPQLRIVPSTSNNAVQARIIVTGPQAPKGKV